MNEIKGHDYAWSKSWIEFKAPSAQGVYLLRNKTGEVIFVGKGNIRQRLLRHWNRENSRDAAVWNYDPRFFSFELTSNPAEREAELTRQLNPVCLKASRFKFRTFW